MNKSVPKRKEHKNQLLGTKIGAKLLACVFCSLCISVLLFASLYLLSNWSVEQYSSTSYAYNKLSEFQDYVDRNRITSDDFSMLTAWLNKNDIKFMHIYRGEELIFNSDDPIDDEYTYDERERDYYWANRAITFIDSIEYVEKVQRTGGFDTATFDSAQSVPTIDGTDSAVQEPTELETDLTVGQTPEEEPGTVDSIESWTGVSNDGIPYPVPGTDTPANEREDEYVSFDDLYDEHITYETLNVFLAVGTDMRLLIILLIISVLISLIVFGLLILRFISFRVIYVTQLANEVAQIEGGMIDRSVTVHGKDEIALLAQNVEDMRIALVERLQSEKEAYDANRELITAMSHDLRTPLSALIGYLEIIGSGVYSAEEQKEVYIQKSVEKAYQLKAMSDKLFDYFTVFKSDGTDELSLEIYNGFDLLSQMISEYTYMLEEKGFLIGFEGMDPEMAAPDSFQVQVDSSALLRVFDNIYSNLLKYADQREPVQISLTSDEQTVRVSVTNRINRTAVKVASTKIGLKSCRRLMSRMNGTLRTRAENGYYTVILIIKKYLSSEYEE